MSKALQRGLSSAFLLTRHRVQSGGSRQSERETVHFLPSLVHLTMTPLTVANVIEWFLDILS